MNITVVGLGYVGLPLAIHLAKHFPVTGFDVKTERIEQLQSGYDLSHEIDRETIQQANIHFTSNPEGIKESNFIIVCVPTPINKAKKPDLSFLEKASELVGKHLTKGSVVVYESTVYPGVTEEVCLPLLEHHSNLKCPQDFSIGYSPERVNPGDKERTINKITKVVAGIDEETTNLLADVYGKITHVHKAESIKVAEAAKVIENIQRDLNIALMNELHLIFDKLNIDTKQVLNAARTKWNFHDYKPGLVGGHCIGIDPYYLTYKAEEVGYHPQVILAGRRINDNMHSFHVKRIIKLLGKHGKISNAKILVLGVTFKPNIRDFRNSRVKQLIKELKEYGFDVHAHDPHVSDAVIQNHFDAKPSVLHDSFDIVVQAVNHDSYKEDVQQLKTRTLFIDIT
ncbi:MAG: UDP-N-acetyl-D-galactosamine dehydrogenase [Nanoarchaeota archaeon]|nr:UDP-N-acetyl-D-galactosamine dehydrogenase [Nanoarchaeota archaeon]|tara:strand:- start:1868 stop:3058 length:1191 start_codon:yes stop_codon:yes gene_type:complete